MLYQAHRGVSTEYPENTMPAFTAACDQGYLYIELDPGYTADGEIVVLHDKTLNRTCRYPDGRELEEPTEITQVTWAQVQALDAGLWKGEQFRGTSVPLLRDVLALAKERGVAVKIDNKIARFPDEMLEKVFSLVEESGADAAFTCTTDQMLQKIVSRFPKATIHYDGNAEEWRLKEVAAQLAENPLFIWVALDTPLTAWVKIPKASPELCAAAKKYGKLGIWILHTEEELRRAEALGADIIETTGSLKP